MRNNIEKYRRMTGVKDEAFQDREREHEKHWVSKAAADERKARKRSNSLVAFRRRMMPPSRLRARLIGRRQ